MMMNKALLLIAFQILIPWSLWAQTVSIFRIGDHLAPQSSQSLGHCTGFYIHDSGEIITAAHCNHFKDMEVISQTGEVLLNLPNAEKHYLTYPRFGPVDVIVIKLNANEEARLKNLSELIYEPHTNEWIVAGYPTVFRNQSLSLFKCVEFASDPKPFSKFWIEKKFNSTHIQCPISDKVLDPKVTLNLTHAQLGGLSGGPVFKDKKVIGVVYHYQQPDVSGSPSYYKVQRLSELDQWVSEQDALSRYRLKQALFEEIKIPNLIVHQMSSLIALGIKGPYSLQATIDNIAWISSNTLRVTFNDQEYFDISADTLTVSLKNFFQSYLPDEVAEITDSQLNRL